MHCMMCEIFLNKFSCCIQNETQRLHNILIDEIKCLSKEHYQRCYADELKRIVQMQIAVTLGIFNLKFKYVGPI